MELFESVYRFIGWWIINIDLLLILFLLIGGALAWLHRKKWARRFIFLGCFGFVFLGLSSVSVMIFSGLENRFPQIQHIPPETKGMILLGGSFDEYTSLARKETAYNLTAGKFIRFVELALENPGLQLIFTGNPFEAETAKKGFKALGLNPDRVVFEGMSKSTIENAAKTLELLKNNEGETWVLVTSAYHMPRSVGLFRKGGIKLIPYPVDYHTTGTDEWLPYIGLTVGLDAWSAASREWLGMFANYLTGRSDELYPGP